MKLDFIPLDKLVVSKANMRYGKKAPDVSDILPTVRSRGVIQPVIVRPNCAPDGYEIVAGSRRFHAAKIVAEERRAAGDTTPEPQDSMLPCAILDDGDDAAAIEASMIENMARLDPDEVTQWENFTRLVREGRKVEDIAATFGLPDLTVKRVLALGNLPDAIAAAYDDRGPNKIADYAFGLAQTFSSYLDKFHILSEQNKSLQQSRLALCAVTLRTLELSLSLLGIEVPERM